MRLSKALSIYMIVVPCLAVGNSARGQSAGAVGPRRFGVVGGMSSATFGGKDASDPTPDSRTGFMGGVMAVLPMRPSLSFQPELLFTMKGAVASDPSGDATFKVNYIQLPLLLRYDFPTTSTAKPFLIGGPAIAFRQACSLEVKGSFGFTSQCEDFGTLGGPDVEKMDYSALIGGGLAFDVSGKVFTIGARYDYSFTKLFKDDTDVKHRVWSVLTTFEFPLAK